MKTNSEELKILLKKINQDIQNEINLLIKRISDTLSPEEKKNKTIDRIGGNLFRITYTNSIMLNPPIFVGHTTEQQTLINRCRHLAKLQHYTCPEIVGEKTVDLKKFNTELENARNSDAFKQSGGGAGLNIIERIWDKIQAFFTKTPVRLKFFNQISNDIETYDNSIKLQQ